MKRYLAAAALALPLALGSCAEVWKAVDTVCTEQAKMPANVVAALDALDVHSAAGVYWANAKSACAAGVPVIGVSETWGSQMLGAVKALAPAVIPWLVGLL